MAAITVYAPRVVKPDRADAEIEENLLVLNGQTWNPGDLLDIDNAGLLSKCADDADAGTGGVKYMALGAQTDPGNSTTKSQSPVLRLTADTVLEINAYHATPASAVVTGANIGIQYGLDHATSAGANGGTIPVVDVADTTNLCFEIVGIPADFDDTTKKGTTGDTYPRVRVKVINTCLQAAPQA